MAGRKLDPKSARKGFAKAIGGLTTAGEEIAPSKASAATKDLFAEGLLLSAAVHWEGFLHDLFVAYINRDNSKLAATYQARLRQSAEGKYADVVATRVTVALPKELTRAEIGECPGLC
jgi:hypothetical protein